MRLDIESAVSSLPAVENDVAEVNSEITRVLKQGVAAAQNGDRPMARTLLLNVTEADPRNVDAWLWLASISEYPEELLVFLNNALAIDPENSRALTWKSATCSLLAKTHVQRGQTAMQEHQNDYAMQCFDKAIETDQNCEMAWFWKASLLDDENDKLECLERALSLNPENAETVAAVKDIESDRVAAKMHDVKLLATAGDHAQANEMLDSVLESEPENTEAWVLRSHLARSFEDKLTAYDRVLQYDPSNAFAQYGFDFLSELAESIKPAEALENDPDVTVYTVDEPAELPHASGSVESQDFAPDYHHVDDRYEDEMSTAESLSPEVAHEPTWATESVPAEAESTAIEVFNFHSSENEVSDQAQFDDHYDDEVLVTESDPQEASDEPAWLSHSVGDQADTAESESVRIFTFDQEDMNDQPESNAFAVHSPAESAELEVSAMETEHVETNGWAENFDTDDNGSENNIYAATVVEESVDQKDESLEYQDSPSTPESDPELLTRVTDESVDPFDSVVSPWAPVASHRSIHETVADVSPFDETQEFNSDLYDSVEPLTADELAALHETVSPDFSPVTDTYREPEPWTLPSAEVAPAPLAEVSDWNDAEVLNAEVLDTEVLDAEVFEDSLPTTQACPFCSAAIEPQSFSCGECHAVLTLSDLESLLSNDAVDHDAVQAAVTKMETEWKSREFSEDEIKMLGIGHFNLKSFDMGVAYLQEASRNNPNDVILASQLNTLAIRLGEKRKQDKNLNAIPKGKTILVVDDSATVRKLISSKLEKCGHHVLCAVDGVEAMEMIADVTPDLVLLDITMPRMDGYQVCKEIRSRATTKDIPVVMISGRDGFFDKVRGRMAGSTDHITKPFGPETLMKTLETYLSTSNGVSE